MSIMENSSFNPFASGGKSSGGGGTGDGTVTKVDFKVKDNSGLKVEGAPIVDSGTITLNVDNTHSIPTKEQISNWNSKYDLPSDGIPKSDLSEDVRASLNLANTSIQEELDPTVPEYVKDITEEDITSWNNKYELPNSGIPKSDLATAIQDSLGKADTALQEHQSLAGYVPTTRKVAGKELTSDITLSKSDVGLSNVNNTSDMDKPISTATQTALNNKVDKVTGKGLSTNDFTNADKAKVDEAVTSEDAIEFADITTPEFLELENEVSELKEDLAHLDDFMEKAPTTQNIFNGFDTVGNITNGVYDSNATDYKCTGKYISIVGNNGGLYYWKSEIAPACNVSFYNDSNTFLIAKGIGSGTGAGVVSIPSDATKIKVAVHKSFNGQLAIGLSAFVEYVPYNYLLKFKDNTVDTGTIKNKSITPEKLLNNLEPIFYQIDTFSAGGEECHVVSKYGKNYDIDNRLWVRNRGNYFFDFHSLRVISNNTMTVNSDVSTYVDFMANETEWHSPFKVTADANADGDCASDNKFTGGSHDYTNGSYTGTATLRLENLRYFADGREVENPSSGRCNKFEIRWTNYVQGSNTEKIDGTGREILQENHRLVFDGDVWEDYTELIALENIHIASWYGLQMVGIKTWYPNYRFVGDVNRAPYTNNAEHISGGRNASKIICWGDSHKLELEIDTNFDLGKREYFPQNGTNSAFSSNNGNKAYFNVVNGDGLAMTTGQMYCLKGTYRFMPV